MGRMLSKLTCALGLFLALGMGRADASLITYTYSTTASGALGATSFANSLVTITATGDTSLVTNPGSGIFFNAPSVASVSVAGVGSGVFTGDILVVANQGIPAVGISDVGQNRAILFTTSSAYSSYELKTSVPATTGGASLFNPGVSFATTSGGFILRTVGEVTFTASTAVVPEPSTFALAASAILGGLVAARRSRRATSLVA